MQKQHGSGDFTRIIAVLCFGFGSSGVGLQIGIFMPRLVAVEQCASILQAVLQSPVSSRVLVLQELLYIRPAVDAAKNPFVVVKERLGLGLLPVPLLELTPEPFNHILTDGGSPLLVVPLHPISLLGNVMQSVEVHRLHMLAVSMRLVVQEQHTGSDFLGVVAVLRYSFRPGFVTLVVGMPARQVVHQRLGLLKPHIQAPVSGGVLLLQE